jgi:hypothetical protein
MGLRIEERRGCGYRIGWWDADDGCLGLMLGESPKWLTAPAPKGRDDWGCWAAERAAAETKPDEGGGGKAFVWYSEASARAALRLCKAALKAEREMPAWAKTATLAGWKAPKGWQP